MLLQQVFLLPYVPPLTFPLSGRFSCAPMSDQGTWAFFFFGKKGVKACIQYSLSHSQCTISMFIFSGLDVTRTFVKLTFSFGAEWLQPHGATQRTLKERYAALCASFVVGINS